MEQFVLTYRKGFSSSSKNRLHFLLLYSLIEPIWSLQAAFGKTVLNVSGLITYLLLGLGAVCYLIPWNLWMVSDQIVNKVTSHETHSECIYCFFLYSMRLKPISWIRMCSLEVLYRCNGDYIYWLFRYSPRTCSFYSFNFSVWLKWIIIIIWGQSKYHNKRFLAVLDCGYRKDPSAFYHNGASLGNILYVLLNLPWWHFSAESWNC
jgi:hypothetical protein